MGRASLLIRRAFAAVAVAWAVALPGAAMLAARPLPSVLEYVAAVLIYAIGSVVCHQLPDRSFHFWGRQLPVCARCTGIYMGAAVAVLVIAVARLRPRPSTLINVDGSKDRAPIAGVVVATLASIPTIATIVFEWTARVTPSNSVRASAGFVLGAAITTLVLAPVDDRAMR